MGGGPESGCGCLPAQGRKPAGRCPGRLLRALRWPRGLCSLQPGSPQNLDQRHRLCVRPGLRSHQISGPPRGAGSLYLGPLGDAVFPTGTGGAPVRGYSPPRPWVGGRPVRIPGAPPGGLLCTQWAACDPPAQAQCRSPRATAALCRSSHAGMSGHILASRAWERAQHECPMSWGLGTDTQAPSLGLSPALTTAGRGGTSLDTGTPRARAVAATCPELSPCPTAAPV